MIVIGQGRIGSALQALDPREVDVITRTGGTEIFERRPHDPIVVATRNDDLDAVLARVPKARTHDLVFVQNGMLRPWLERNQLDRVTRGLLFFAVPTRGAAIDPGGTSVFSGPHAQKLVQWLERHEIPARAVEETAFREIELEKLVWNSAFGLLGDALDATVGVLVREHAMAVDALAEELILIGARSLEIEVDIPAMLTRLHRYSASIPEFRANVKEWPWRNGWFVEIARKFGEALPRHSGWLSELGWDERGPA